MICINRVLIENFQSHENTELTFHDGLNVIIGPSDHGKSAVIRAIKWVLYNEPRGTDFIRQNTNFARVTIWINTGYTITRERTSSKNRYILADSDGNTNIYEGFGNEVPHEIVSAHGILKVMLDTDINSSLNIGGQLEGPFLISESGSVRAKAIGRLTGLHIIDKSIRDSATDLRRENQTRDRISGELNEVNEKLKEYQYLDILEEKIGISAEYIKRIEEGIDRSSTLTNIKSNLLDISLKYKESEYELSKLEKIDECDLVLRKIEIGFLRLKALDNLRNRYTDNLSAALEMETILKKTDQVNSGLSLIKQINEKTLMYEKLKKAHKIMKDIESELIGVTRILDSTKSLEKTDIMLAQIKENNTRTMRLAAAKEKLADCELEIIKVNKLLNKSVGLLESDAVFSGISKKSELLLKLESIKNRLDPILKNINEGNIYLDSNKEEINKYLKAYIDLLKKTGICPLCNSKIVEDKLSDIIKHYGEVH